MASSIQGLNSTYVSMINSAMKKARESKNQLEQEKSNLKNRKNVLSDLDSKLSTFNTQVEKLNDNIINQFDVMKAESSDSDLFTASAGSNANIGSHSISVDRLATEDTRVSNVYTSSSENFSNITSDQTFSIQVAHPTEDNPNNRKNIDVTISADTFSKNNEEVVSKIAEKINNAMNSAVTDDKIADGETVQASVVSQTEGNSRLVLSSSSKGYKHRINFSDSSSNLLSQLGVNNNTKATDSSGGYITEIGTNPENSQLNSKFQVDGLNFYRSSNEVKNAIQGVTLNLKQTFSKSENLEVNTDTEAVQKKVTNFIDKYNKTLDFLKNKTQINPDGENGTLSSDMTYRNMELNLRNTMISSISTANNEEYNSLRDIGIEIEDDGKLSLDDKDKFNNALKEDPANVGQVFRSEDGIANRLSSYLDRYIDTGGMIQDSKQNISNNINRIEDDIYSEKQRLTEKKRRLRNKYARVQKMMKSIQSQQKYLSLFSSR